MDKIDPIDQRNQIDQMKFLIVRILGNDIETIHSPNQTYDNLKFTLEHEPSLPNTRKIYLLNRIADHSKRLKIIRLLDEYDQEYFELPFDRHKFIDVYESSVGISNNRRNLRETVRKLHSINLYLINNNGARNYALEYCRSRYPDVDYYFVLDSNSFFTVELYRSIVDRVDPESQYLIIPQIRLKNLGLNNQDLLDTEKLSQALENPITFEPQVAFKRTAKHSFNPLIPYGCAPKAEFLRLLGVPGPWESWLDNESYFGIPDREDTYHEKWQMLSGVVRLHPGNGKNDVKTNFIGRVIGVYELAQSIYLQSDVV